MDRIRTIRSPGYNWNFNSENGYFARWGDKPEDDPPMSPWGPEIADIEISTICSQGCRFCYKGNTACGKNMSFSQFVSIFHKLPKNLTQIAVGIGDVSANPDTFKILHYTRDNGVVPNITINGNASDNDLNELVMVCGAIAVSNYDLDKTLTVIAKLDELRIITGANSPLKQINIHQLLSEETYSECMALMKHPLPLALNAIVFLGLKPKGRSVLNQMRPLVSLDKLRNLVNFALENNVPIGFDSCTCNSFLKAIKGRPNEKELAECADPCESTCFSIYVDVNCNAMPCSFAEGLDVPSISILETTDFMKDVWFNPEMVKWRENLIKCGRNCPLYNLEMK